MSARTQPSEEARHTQARARALFSLQNATGDGEFRRLGLEARRRALDADDIGARRFPGVRARKVDLKVLRLVGPVLVAVELRDAFDDLELIVAVREDGLADAKVDAERVVAVGQRCRQRDLHECVARTNERAREWRQTWRRRKTKERTTKNFVAPRDPPAHRLVATQRKRKHKQMKAFRNKRDSLRR